MNIKTILIILAGVLIGVAICYLLGYTDVYPNIVYTTLNGWFSGFDISAVISNPATILTAAGGAAAVAIPLITKLNSAKNQLTATTEAAKTKISMVSNELGTAQDQLQNKTLSLEDANETITALTAKANTAQTQYETLKVEFDKQQNRYYELQRLTSADVLKELPGNTTITKPNGETITVVEKVVVK